MCCQASRTPSSASDSDETPSPKSHTTQLINLKEMEQLSAQEQLDEAAAHQQQEQFAQQHAQMQQLQAHLARQSLDTAQQQLTQITQQPQQHMAAASSMPVQHSLSDSQLGASLLPPAAGLGTRLLGSSEYSGDHELDAEQLQLLTDEELLEDDELCVNCQQAEENKLSFQLKFTEPEGERLLLACCCCGCPWVLKPFCAASIAAGNTGDIRVFNIVGMRNVCLHVAG